MLQVYRPPPDMAPWIDGAVAIRLGPDIEASHFPAMPHAMLTMRLLAPPGQGLQAARLRPPITFHTLSTVPTVHVHAGEMLALGLLLRPAAAAALLAARTGALVDQVLPWEALAGPTEAARVEDEVDAATCDTARLQALLVSFRRTMAQVCQGREREHEALCTLVGRHGATAGHALGIGHRQLERRCRAVLGLSPKRFQRLVRLHEALSAAVAATARNGADLALGTGFYDQSHLARDLRELAGEPLGAVLSATQADGRWWSLASRRSLIRGASPLLADARRSAR